MIELTANDLMHPRAGPPSSRPGWVYEFKYDGYRLLVLKRADEVQLVTRQGKDATTWFPAVVASIRRMRGDLALDAEVCRPDENGIPDFEAMQRAVAKRIKTGFTLYVFDLLAEGRKDLRDWPLLKRKARLEKRLERHPQIGLVRHLEVQGKLLFEEAVSMGLEGVVGKRADAPYRAGRSYDWIKSKPAGLHVGWKRRPRDRPPSST